MSKSKLPTDTNKRAKRIVAIATGESKEIISGKNTAAVPLGRIGYLKCCKVWEKKLTSKKCS